MNLLRVLTLVAMLQMTRVGIINIITKQLGILVVQVGVKIVI